MMRTRESVSIAAVAIAATAAMGFVLVKLGNKPAVRKYLQRTKLAVLPHIWSGARRFTTPPVAVRGAPQGNISLDPSEYPEVRRDDTVETLHGVQIADPYRWLEDPDSPETIAFVEAQNTLTDRILKKCASRDKFKELLTRLYNYPRFGCPFKRGSRYYYTHNSGLQAQNVIFTQSDLRGEPKVFLDPNKFSSDGTVALDSFTFSEDGRLVAYSTGSGGSDWRKIEVMRVDEASGEGKKLNDVLEYVKFSSIAWTHDNLGFFYNRYEPPSKSAELGTETDTNVDQQLWYHVVGTAQADDKFVYAVPEHPDWFISAEVTDDGRYLLLSLSAGCEPTNRLYYGDINALPRSASTGALDLTLYDRSAPVGVRPLPLTKLVDNFEAQWSYVANEGTSFTFKTNLAAPRYRLVRTDIAAPGHPKTWPDVIQEHERDLLQWASALKGDIMAVCWLRDVASVLQLSSLGSGQLLKSIPLPGLGSVRSFSGRRTQSEMFFSYTDFMDPGSIYRLDTADERLEPELFRKTELNVKEDLTQLETKQVFVESKDGTKVPMFIVGRKGLQLDGSNPTLLYGYGGFNISLEPGFSVTRLCWMLAYGGVYAVANLRGGGEYGITWREAGSLHNKQNVFDDFIASAEYLIEAGYTTPAKLVTQGGSNGGLLVAACANQRPDLFGAVVAQVGVMDMLRFHKFTIGHAWITDYGSPDLAHDFPYLLAYSPLHNVRMPIQEPRQYPAMLLTTGDHDDRVVPLHTHKLLATLQHIAATTEGSKQLNPLVARVEVRAGHGAGKPTDKIIAEAADIYAFVVEVVGAKWRQI
ncbi:Prolyl endopeptidase [Coccomyxa sp. Obi]|nr:Prolyl endopeptidase [Coccomyxa sp. Obi]